MDKKKTLAERMGASAKTKRIHPNRRTVREAPSKMPLLIARMNDCAVGAESREDERGIVRLWPILQSDFLTFNYEGISDDLLRWFAGEFARVLNELPNGANLRILEWWLLCREIELNVSAYRGRDLAVVPSVVIVPDSIWHRGDAHACCNTRYTEINFIRSTIEQTPPGLISALISHEFAHVYQRSTDEIGARQFGHPSQEIFAEKMVAEWGLSEIEKQYDEWWEKKLAG